MWGGAAVVRTSMGQETGDGLAIERVELNLSLAESVYERGPVHVLVEGPRFDIGSVQELGVVHEVVHLAERRMAHCTRPNTGCRPQAKCTETRKGERAFEFISEEINSIFVRIREKLGGSRKHES